MLKILVLGFALIFMSCSPRRVVLPTLSAIEGSGAWLLYAALEEGVDIPIVGETLLSATEILLPKTDNKAAVLTLTEKGLFLRGQAIAPVQEIDGVLHLVLEEGRQTPQGEIPEAIWMGLKAANPRFDPLRSETGQGQELLYLVADHRSSSASLAAIGIAGLFAGYLPPILVGLSPDGTPRGFRFVGARPCPSTQPPRIPDLSVSRGMGGNSFAMAVGKITQIGDCKGIERPDWFTRRLESIGNCYMEESLAKGWDQPDSGVLTVVLDADGNLQSSSIRSPWAGKSPQLQSCVHAALQNFRAPRAKGACILSRDFRIQMGDTSEIEVSGPPIASPHYGRKVRWAFAAMDRKTVFMNLNHQGSATECPSTTSGVIGWNIQGVELDRSRMNAVLDGIDFDLDFLGLRVAGDVPLNLLVDTANAWVRKGTHIGITVRRF